MVCTQVPLSAQKIRVGSKFLKICSWADLYWKCATLHLPFQNDQLISGIKKFGSFQFQFIFYEAIKKSCFKTDFYMGYHFCRLIKLERNVIKPNRVYFKIGQL